MWISRLSHSVLTTFVLESGLYFVTFIIVCDKTTPLTLSYILGLNWIKRKGKKRSILPFIIWYKHILPRDLWHSKQLVSKASVNNIPLDFKDCKVSMSANKKRFVNETAGHSQRNKHFVPSLYLLYIDKAGRWLWLSVDEDAVSIS